MIQTKAWGTVVMVAFAWILWQHVEIWKEEKLVEKEWNVKDAFETKKECVQSAENPKEIVVIGIKEMTPGGRNLKYDFKCLPSDFDPKRHKFSK